MKEIIIKEFAERLDAVLSEKNIPRKKASLGAGLNETWVRDVIEGKTRNPRMDSISKMADYLNMDVHELLTGEKSIDIETGLTPNQQKLMDKIKTLDDREQQLFESMTETFFKTIKK